MHLSHREPMAPLVEPAFGVQKRCAHYHKWQTGQNLTCAMSGLGLKRTSDWRLLMSALPPKADIAGEGVRGIARLWR